MTPIGPPVIRESGHKQLRIQQSLGRAGTFTIICSEDKFTCIGVGSDGRALQWAWDYRGELGASFALQNVSSNTITGHYLDQDYAVRVLPGQGSCGRLSDGSILFNPNAPERSSWTWRVLTSDVCLLPSFFIGVGRAAC